MVCLKVPSLRVFPLHLLHSRYEPSSLFSEVGTHQYPMLENPGTGSSRSRLLVPLSCKSALFALMTRRCGTDSLLSCASYLGRFPPRSIVVLKLFVLTVLEWGAVVSSSGLEEAL